MHVTHVSFHHDPSLRDADALFGAHARGHMLPAALAAAGLIVAATEQGRVLMAAGVWPRDRPIFEALPGSSDFTPGDVRSARARTGIHGDPALVWSSHLDANKDPLTGLAALEQAAVRL